MAITSMAGKWALVTGASSLPSQDGKTGSSDGSNWLTRFSAVLAFSVGFVYFWRAEGFEPTSQLNQLASQLWARDETSNNGTYVAGARIAPRNCWN